jgi:cytochrome P450
MMRLTLHVVASTLLCTRVEADVERVGTAFTAASEALMAIVRSAYPLPPHWPTPQGRKLMRAAAELDDIVMRIIRERRESKEDPGDVLSMLLSARDAEGVGLDDVALRDEVMTLLLAAHETTANALTWALSLVASFPDVAEQLTNEVDVALSGRAPGYADLPKLPYCLQVLKEALRLYPPAYLQGRLARVDTELGGYRLPKGQLVFMNIYGIHRREQLFERAGSFLPERFAGQAERRWPKNAFMPFGAGSRICVGNHFALMEGQLVLARFAQRLVLARSITRIADGEPLITLRPRGRVAMRVSLRA